MTYLAEVDEMKTLRELAEKALGESGRTFTARQGLRLAMTPTVVLRLLALDEAWKQVEAALPEGWGVGIEPSSRGYEVGAGRNQWHTWTGKAYPTLTEALTELATQLAALEGVPA